MNINTIVVVVIILAIMVYVIYHYTWGKRPPSFWKRQHVSRNYTTFGILHDTLEKTLDILEEVPTSMEIKVIKTGTPLRRKPHTYKVMKTMDVCDFLNSHFLKSYVNTPAFLKTHVPQLEADYPDAKGVFLGLLEKDNQTLVGSIACLFQPLQVYNTTRSFGMVDYLSVHKKYRNRSLATTLISQTLRIYPNQCFVFKKEDKPLAFDSVVEFNYYSLPLLMYRRKNTETQSKSSSPHVWKPLDASNIEQAYEFYRTRSRHFALWEPFTLKRFRSTYLDVKAPGQIEFLCRYPIEWKDDLVDKITAISYAITYDLKEMGKTWNVVELAYLLEDEGRPVSLSCLQDWLDYYRENSKIKPDLIVLSDLCGHHSAIAPMQLASKRKCYIHFYNFGLEKPLEKHEVCVF